MSKDPGKNNDQSMFKSIVQTVIAGVIMLVCTTLYNLVLAHIWPVTIHFGEYSLNNFIFIFVSIVSSLLFAVIILGLEILYLFTSLSRGLIWLVTPREKRKQRKHQWFEYILDAFLLASVGMMNVFLWLTMALKDRKEERQSAPSEKAPELLTKMLFPNTKQKPKQKQEMQHPPSVDPPDEGSNDTE